MRLGELVGLREIYPYLEELEWIRSVALHERKHLGVNDSFPRREPLGVPSPETCGRTERIGVIDEAFAHDGEGLEAAVRVLREAGHHFAVVHAKSVFCLEVLAQIAPAEGHSGAEALVSCGIGVRVMDAEQKRILGWPGKTERTHVQDRRGHALSVTRSLGRRPPSQKNAPFCNRGAIGGIAKRFSCIDSRTSSGRAFDEARGRLVRVSGVAEVTR